MAMPYKRLPLLGLLRARSTKGCDETPKVSPRLVEYLYPTISALVTKEQPLRKTYRKYTVIRNNQFSIGK